MSLKDHYAIVPTKPYTATQVLKDREENQKYFMQDHLKDLLPTEFHNEYRTCNTAWVIKEKPMTIGYKVPAEDIVAAWEEQRAKYEMDLQQARARQKELKEKDVDDSCVNGKVDNARRNIAILTLQIKYIDRSEDVFLMDHEMLTIFSGLSHLDNPSGAVAERPY